jgi:hypothetical protein
LRIDAAPGEDLYFCSICLEAYDAESIDDKSLTLEYIPPESIGGKGILLTCQDCNNDAGTRLDAFAANQHKFDKFRSGAPGPPLRFRAKGVAIAATNTIHGTALVLLESQSNPDRYRSLVDELEAAEAAGHSPFEVLDLAPILRLDSGRASASYIRAAYLVPFALYGYRFVFQETLDGVRDQIRSGGTHPATERW